MEIHQSLALRQGRLRERNKPIQGIVIHTTGAGPWSRWFKRRKVYSSPFHAALHIYKFISPYSGHFLVCGETGRVAQLVPPTRIAWHVGSKGSWKYRLTGWARNKGFGWFPARFGFMSPRELLGGALWRKGSANAITIGIEVSPPKSGPRDAWSDACWANW